MTDSANSFIPGAFAPEPDSQPEPTPTTEPSPIPDPYPGWTYPTRMCRICREDVVPTITSKYPLFLQDWIGQDGSVSQTCVEIALQSWSRAFPALPPLPFHSHGFNISSDPRLLTIVVYPPGLPMKYQRPVVEYRNDDEYGRLIRPCKCRGGMRYIHELCLQRSRTEGVRPGSLWKCPTCGYQFNFKRLSVQKYLGSKLFSGLLTVSVMMILVFVLGFVADPIINLYVDPYDTIVGNEPYWSEVDVVSSSNTVSGWSLHFTKGLISMGLVGFLKTAFLNPFNFLNIRGTGFVSTRRTGSATTGRDRAVNVSWIAVAIGITSAFYFFYKWVQTIIKHTLQRIGNHVVDTSLPGDDEDLKPPPDWQSQPSGEQSSEQAWQSAEKVRNDSTLGHKQDGHVESQPPDAEATVPEEPSARGSKPEQAASVHSQDSDVDEIDGAARESSSLGNDRGISSALEDAHEQGWSFVGVPRQR